MPLIQSRASGSTEAPRQFEQSSRKGKKAWRKNVNVTEIERGLAELNEEVIRGGVIREKKSSELFTIDLQGDSKASKNPPKHASKGLKADEILAKRSAVPAIPGRKRPGERTTDGLVPTKRQRNDWVPHKELVRLRKVADGHHAVTIEAKEATYDVWENISVQEAEESHDFLPALDSVKQPKSMRQKPISLAANGKEVPAVPAPAGGFSYNPLSTDYENRLAEESARALDLERERVNAEIAQRERQEAAARSAAEAEAAEERANMSEWEEDSEWEGFQSGAEDERPNTKQPRRKTQAQKNRIKRRKEEERLAKQKAAMKARRRQEERIKEIADEIDEREQQKALQGAFHSDTDDEANDQKLRRRQLGKFKLPEKDMELVLPDELEDSLRRLKPEGNLLKDRYRSMLVRGKLESRRHIPFKKLARRKVTEKWTHKDFVL
ncbi:hypothetical protein C2857_001798 [Epichloe festucae Fl1]|uniref:Ribosome biogenesis protein NOP53 n=1 Tax=Epichloe festucae (strain Fl1) TaxID=877507 RepID=A0A7S9KUD6_EPIFF|nr:hypothetical protein C2857_001798 [Epichloe festucae Fl1]